MLHRFHAYYAFIVLLFRCTLPIALRIPNRLQPLGMVPS